MGEHISSGADKGDQNSKQTDAPHPDIHSGAPRSDADGRTQLSFLEYVREDADTMLRVYDALGRRLMSDNSPALRELEGYQNVRNDCEVFLLPDASTSTRIDQDLFELAHLSSLGALEFARVSDDPESEDYAKFCAVSRPEHVELLKNFFALRHTWLSSESMPNEPQYNRFLSAIFDEPTGLSLYANVLQRRVGIGPGEMFLPATPDDKMLPVAPNTAIDTVERRMEILQRGMLTNAVCMEAFRGAQPSLSESGESKLGKHCAELYRRGYRPFGMEGLSMMVGQNVDALLKIAATPEATEYRLRNAM